VSGGIGAYGAVFVGFSPSKGLVESIDESFPLFKRIRTAVGLNDSIRQGDEVFDLIFEVLEGRQRRRRQGPLEKGQAGPVKARGIGERRFGLAFVSVNAGGHTGTRIVEKM
jgi:hypothetical protein